MKISDLREKSDKDLEKILKSLRKDIEKVVNDVMKTKEKNVSKIRYLKRDYARVSTILNERKIMEGLKEHE